MLIRIAAFVLAIVAALAAISSPVTAYASGKRQHIPLTHAGARSFQPPDPCKRHCGTI